MMSAVTYKWSIEEWHKLVEFGVLEGKSVELLEGEIIQMSPEGVPHRSTNHKVVKYLRKLLDGVAEVYESHPITLNNSEPEPDIAIVRLPESIYDTHHPYAQDIYWLIEIYDRTLKIDLEQKATIYARNRITEYWVLDLAHRKLIVHTHPDSNSYSQIQQLTSGTITPQAFATITITLDQLLLF